MRSRACFVLFAAALLVLASGAPRTVAAQEEEVDYHAVTPEQLANMSPAQLEALRALQARQDEAAALKAQQQAQQSNDLHLEAGPSGSTDAAAAAPATMSDQPPRATENTGGSLLGALFGGAATTATSTEVPGSGPANQAPAQMVTNIVPAEPVPESLPVPVAAAPTPASALADNPAPTPIKAPAATAAPAPAPAPAKAPAPAPAKSDKAKSDKTAADKAKSDKTAAKPAAKPGPASTGDVLAAFGLVVSPDAAAPPPEPAVELPAASANPKLSYIPISNEAIGVRAMIAKGKHAEAPSATRAATPQATPKKLAAAKSSAEAPAKRGGSLLAAVLTVAAVFAVSLL